MKTLFRRLPTLIGAAVLSACLTPAYAGGSAFDSVTEFSATQGLGGWTYGYYSAPSDATSFTVMSNYNLAYPNAWSEGTSPGAPWTLLLASGGHPNGTNSGTAHDAVRRWTSGSAGTLDVAGTYSMANSGSTALGVIVDGTLVWAGLASGISQSFTASSIVGIGSHVDFVINSNGVDANDATNFAVTGNVTAVPEPETYAMLLAGLGALGLVGRRRCAG